MYSLIKADSLEFTFPNIEIALRILDHDADKVHRRTLIL